MPTYKIYGAHGETGEDTYTIVTADSPKEAEAFASIRKVMVSRVVELKGGPGEAEGGQEGAGVPAVPAVSERANEAAKYYLLSLAMIPVCAGVWAAGLWFKGIVYSWDLPWLLELVLVVPYVVVYFMGMVFLALFGLAPFVIPFMVLSEAVEGDNMKFVVMCGGMAGAAFVWWACLYLFELPMPYP